MIFHENRLRYILYVIYFTGVSLCLLYFLFPEQVIRNSLNQFAKTIFPETTMEIGKVNPIIFPPGVSMKPIYISESGKPLIQLDFLDIYPRIYNVLSKNGKTYQFNGNLLGGTMEGLYKEFQDADNLKQQLNMKFTGIKIANIPALNEDDTFKMIGNLNGWVDLTHGNVLQADMKLTLSEGEINITHALLGNLRIVFSEFSSVISQKDTTIEITQGYLHGDDADLIISGNIYGTWPIINSKLNFSGYFNPHHGFLKKPENKIFINFFPDEKTNDKGFSFLINGNLKTPVFSWN